MIWEAKIVVVVTGLAEGLKMSKIRLNQYSQFEIECCVNGIQQWRLAIHPNKDYDIWEPDFDPETEELSEDCDGNFYITKNETAQIN